MSWILWVAVLIVLAAFAAIFVFGAVVAVYEDGFKKGYILGAKHAANERREG